ncbi:MAG: hypothetical protein R2727_09940 [Bacteroidales bacterium]
MQHIIEMGAYNHNRPASEYSGNFFETDYVIGRLSGYNLKGLKVDRYPGGTLLYGISGELWEVKPGLSKLADYDDLTAMLAQGSKSCDVTAELVWVGEGDENDLKDLDIAGKIVVTSGYPPRSIQPLSKGALLFPTILQGRLNKSAIPLPQYREGSIR